jgi:hypothetical protein
MDTMVADTQTELELVAIDERVAQVATATGEEAERIAAVRLDIRRMRELGVLVDIDVHGTSMFTARASWDELGIPREDTRRKRLKRGSKDLVPHEYVGKLRSLEARFRQSLEKHSFVLQGFRPYRWVPFTAYEAWRQDWARLQAELADLKADILAHYDDFVDAIAADFAQIAREAWDAIRARRPAGAGEFALVTGDGAFEDVDAFVDHVVGRATAQMPPRGAVERSLYVDYRNATVVTGADVEAEWLRQEQLATAREQERARQHQAWQEAQAQQRLFDIEAREAEELSRLRVQEEQAKLAAMRHAELEHARRQLDQMTSPFTEVVEQFRAQIHRDVQEIAASIRKNDHVRGRVAERARGLLDLYRLLGAATASVEAALRDIAALTHEAAQAVAQRAGAHTRAGAIEL